MDDLGVPLFQETSICRQPDMVLHHLHHLFEGLCQTTNLWQTTIYTDQKCPRCPKKGCPTRMIYHGKSDRSKWMIPGGAPMTKRNLDFKTTIFDWEKSPEILDGQQPPKAGQLKTYGENNGTHHLYNLGNTFRFFGAYSTITYYNILTYYIPIEAYCRKSAFNSHISILLGNQTICEIRETALLRLDHWGEKHLWTIRSTRLIDHWRKYCV